MVQLALSGQRRKFLMLGHSNNAIEGEVILWADASLEGIEAGYEEFTIRIREDTGSAKLLRCRGYIGFQVVGFWDEAIIETASLHSGHPFIAECERRLEALPESGSLMRMATGNRLLEIILIDGCKLLVCANHFHTEGIS
jgi:hypothetical protein